MLLDSRTEEQQAAAADKLQPELALASLRKVLGLQPDHPEALAELQEVQQIAIEERQNIAKEEFLQQQQHQQPELP
ncbi:hypothetical protein WJX74_007513 [Apatococcus lobatus]|uniref:Uncharacterized protein n=1 Tax=Apatococcus lobatus TaxID=904363 RepID=A0AAW1Q6S3_9CHLO